MDATEPHLATPEERDALRSNTSVSSPEDFKQICQERYRLRLEEEARLAQEAEASAANKKPVPPMLIEAGADCAILQCERSPASILRDILGSDPSAHVAAVARQQRKHGRKLTSAAALMAWAHASGGNGLPASAFHAARFKGGAGVHRIFAANFAFYEKRGAALRTGGADLTELYEQRILSAHYGNREPSEADDTVRSLAGILIRQG